MEENSNIINALKPRCNVHVSPGFKEQVLKRMESQRKQRRKKIRRISWLSITSLAAACILVLVFSEQPTLSAQILLDRAIGHLQGQTSMEMDLEVRTFPKENFDFIRVDAPYILHHISVTQSDSALVWRIDKSGRVACGDSTGSRAWIPEFKIGWKTRQQESLIGFLGLFLRPKAILQRELSIVTLNDGSKCSVERSGDDFLLTVHAYPQGNYANPYLLNSSIADSENIRKYVFDAATQQLKEMSVYIIAESKKIEVMRTKSIRFGMQPNTSELLRLPSDIDMAALSEIPSGFPSLPPKEVARIVLSAFKDWDVYVLNQVLPSQIVSRMKDDFAGSSLLSVGEPFHSGSSDNVFFIPYILRLKDGRKISHNLSLSQREDGSWSVGGGL